jgi:glycosyltransferase involved in cell wall biosynthesis
MFAAIRAKASKILCVSNFTAREFDRLVGGRAGQLEVIHNGVDVSWFDQAASQRPQANSYFLFVGNLKPHKNIGGLIRAFAGIAGSIPHDLVIVGQKSGFITADNEAEKLARQLNLRVKFTGKVDELMLRQWYCHAEALVFPSLYEGFGFPPIEAMALRCPAIVSNAASMPEICGDAALYCDPHDVGSIADKMLQVIRDAPLRERLVADGPAQARKYSWDDAAHRTGYILRSFT